MISNSYMVYIYYVILIAYLNEMDQGTATLQNGFMRTDSILLICEVPRWQVGLSGVRVHGALGDLFVARSAAESAGLGASAAASPDATGALGAVSL